MTDPPWFMGMQIYLRRTAVAQIIRVGIGSSSLVCQKWQTGRCEALEKFPLITSGPSLVSHDTLDYTEEALDKTPQSLTAPSIALPSCLHASVADEAKDDKDVHPTMTCW